MFSLFIIFYLLSIKNYNINFFLFYIYIKTIKIPNYEQKMLMWEFKNDFNEVITDLDKVIHCT